MMISKIHSIEHCSNDSLSLNTRPLTAFSRLLHYFQDESYSFTIEEADVITQYNIHDEQYIWLVTKGICSVRYKSSSIEIVKLNAPFIFGLADYFCYNGNHMIITETVCYGLKVPASTFVEIIDENNLWKQLYEIAAFYMQSLILKGESSIGADNYTLVRLSILELKNYQSESGRCENAFNFIKRRTKISKSTIYRILSELKKGGYIEIKNGVLISVNKLPRKF